MTKDRTPEELKKLALDIHKGQVFTDRHIDPVQLKSLLHMIFLPLALMDKETHANLAASGPGLIYEYRHKAGPTAINGYPQFFSFGYLSNAEAEAVFKIIRKLEAAEKAALEDTPSEAP